ncbi:MAG TPA: PEP-utilizing enzyme [Polyangiaceae bacterium]|nr:PEP-utilizing enzyme [Polyangiaceae bacterium]
MILLSAAFDLVPLLLVVGVALAFLLPTSVLLELTGGTRPGLSVALLVGLVATAGAIAELIVRRRAARRVPKWVVSLDALALSDAATVAAVGGKALMLARAVRLGAPVPDGIVLTTALVERVLAATSGTKSVEGAFAALPRAARRDIETFLSRSKGKVVVRASFTEAEGKHAYPGVFPAVRDLNPRDRERLVSAVLAIVATTDDAVGREYRRRCGAPAHVARAVIVQRQIDGEITGAVLSRGPSARADVVTVDFARKRSPMRSYGYDLVEGVATPLGNDEKFETPAWVHRLAVLAVTLEADLGAPVHVELALEEGQPYVLDVRKVLLPSRKTWLHARPLDAEGERRPTFAGELRGGLPLVRRVLSELCLRAGASSGVREDEVRYVDGLVYFDAEVLRRIVAALGADVLLRGGLRATVRSIAPVRRRPVPAVPTVTDVTAGAWQELRAWHGAHLLGAAEVRLELVAREWLIRTLLRLVDGTSSVATDRRGHPALRFVLARRVQEAAEEAARQGDVLGRAEQELSTAVARVLARGAEGWNAMFKGDRHLHATLEEIDQFHQDVAARPALEAEWKARREAFDARKDEPTLPRVHRPKLPEEAPGPSTSRRGTERSLSPQLRGVGVTPGTAAGPAVLANSADRGLGMGAILLVPDPRSELCPHVFDAKGVVLLSGGLVSPVALLASELGIPTVLCPSARSLATQDLTIDGTTGSVVVHR